MRYNNLLKFCGEFPKRNRAALCPKKQFLPLMTLIREIKFVGRYKHKAVGFDQRYQCKSVVNTFLGKVMRRIERSRASAPGC
jgi:hypothetical protein